MKRKTVANAAQRQQSKSSQVSVPEARVICVDLSKHHFAVHQFSVHGERRSAEQMGRPRFEKLVRDPQRPRALWVMESCGTSQGWGRLLLSLGDQVKLVPPQFVAKQRIGNKNDGNDADAIYVVHCDKRVHAVPVKTQAQQDDLAVHSLRSQLVAQRTALSNQLRGLLAERLIVAPKGRGGLAELLAQLDGPEVLPDTVPVPDAGPRLTSGLRVTLQSLRKQLEHLDESIDELDRCIAEQVRRNPKAKALQAVPGIGPITASALAAEFAGGVGRYADSRKFAASIGLAPTEHTTGGKQKLGRISRRGNAYLRRLLVQGAQAVVRIAQPAPGHPARPDDLVALASRLLLSKRKTVVVVAIANRMARIAYALLARAAPYRPLRDRTGKDRDHRHPQQQLRAEAA